MHKVKARSANTATTIPTARIRRYAVLIFFLTGTSFNHFYATRSLPDAFEPTQRAAALNAHGLQGGNADRAEVHDNLAICSSAHSRQRAKKLARVGNWQRYTETREQMATRATCKPPIDDRAVSEAEEAVLELVRAMGEGDIVEGLRQARELQMLDDMRCDSMEVLDMALQS